TTEWSSVFTGRMQSSVQRIYPHCAQKDKYLNPEHTKLMMVVQVDLGGFLMPSVINSVMPMSLINFVTDCKSGLKMRNSGS
uniref:START domain-containing protein n=1 Tax=Pseudonaja textilis TaxID=8673 RepID=A0A670ZRU3_PSETE